MENNNVQVSNHYIGIDVMRTIAIICVALSHFWEIGGTPFVGNTYLNTIISYGGEIGVTLFFIISGFSIYCCINNKNNNFRYVGYLKDRLKRILPQYYFSIFILIIISEGATYLSREGVISIVLHIFLIHNLYLPTHGSISGVLWSIGVIFQFYIIAPLLYKLIRKYALMTYICSIVSVIFFKYILFNYFATHYIEPSSYYFIYGRQIFTSLDNFVLGMCLGNCITKDNSCYKNKNAIIFFIITVFVGGLWYIKLSTGIVYSNTVYGYSWHSISAIVLAFIIYSLLKMDIEVYKNKFINLLIYISKYEYGIYIWHLIIANNLLSRSTIIQKLSLFNYWIYSIVLLAISIMSSIFFTKIIDCNLIRNRREIYGK